MLHIIALIVSIIALIVNIFTLINITKTEKHVEDMLDCYIDVNSDTLLRDDTSKEE